MALIEAIFLRPAGSRIIRFDVVAQETRLPEAEVEHLIMKALSCVWRGHARADATASA